MPRELLYPVLDQETYARLGIPSPAAPLTRSGTPYLTGTAVTPPRVAPPESAMPVGAPPASPVGVGSPMPTAPYPVPAAGWSPAPSGPPPQRDRSPMIIATATAAIVVIIIIAAGAILMIKRAQAGADADGIRSVVAAETAAYNDRDFQALLRTRCAADRVQLTDRLDQSTFAASVDGSLGPSGTWRVEVTDIEVDRGAGTATGIETSVPLNADIGGLSPTRMVSETDYRKESGTWLKCTSLGAPGIR